MAIGPLNNFDVYSSLTNITDLEHHKEKYNYSTKREVTEAIQRILSQERINVHELKNLNWQGIECPLTRGQIWRLVLGYENPDKLIRSEKLQMKRLEYLEKLHTPDVSSKKPKPSKQIINSFPRYDIFKIKEIQNSLTNIITLISKEAKISKKATHAMAVPFFIIFLCEFYPIDLEILSIDEEGPQKSYLSIVEADTYWCTSIFIRTYFHNKKNQLCEAAVKSLEKFEPGLYFHMNNEGVQMSFLNRWIKYLFLKDFPLKICIRLFDEFISNKISHPLIRKPGNVALKNNFIVCIVCALVTIFKNQILISTGSKLEDLVSRLPTESWGETEVLILISQAYLYQAIID